MDSRHVPAEPGQIRTLRRLDSQASYRVLEVDGDLVEVEVIDAPGLKPGQRFKFTSESVEAMEFVPSPGG
jgi:hypothetical protein